MCWLSCVDEILPIDHSSKIRGSQDQMKDSSIVSEVNKITFFFTKHILDLKHTKQ